MSIKLILLAGAGLALAGCNASQCGDPRYDGLFTAATCTTGGGYQAQTDELLRQASARRSQADALMAENRGLQRELAGLRGEARAAGQRLVSVNGELARLDRQLQGQSRSGRVTQAEVDLRQQELDDLIAQRRAIAPTDPNAVARVRSLETQVADLRRALN